jgi:plastocyanin
MSIAGHYLKRVPGFLALVSACALAQQTVEVTIRDYKFIPAEVRIRAGDTVKWTNMEKRTSHSVLFPAENGLESERLFPGESWQRTFTVAGGYSYRCGPHEEMKGVVNVD